MAPIYSILLLVAVAAVLWFAVKSNGRRGNRNTSRDMMESLAQENLHLRHIVIQMTKERHEYHL